MNKAKFYPWIFAVVFGIVGTIACMKVACIYQDLANNAVWYGIKFIYRESASAKILRYLGILSFTIISITILVSMLVYFELEPSDNEGMVILLWCLLSPFFAWRFVNRLACDHLASPVAGTLFGSFIGTISGLAIGIIIGFMRKDFLGGLTISIIIFGILGSIVGWFFYNNGFIVSLSIVPAFASIGYAIGVPIKERAEIKRREELERERIRREEERRRREYELEIKKLELKLKQWKEEGYDVSELEAELEEMLK
ncbi:MAG: hypothetical protein OD814_001814 [Candidatus Alkanophagales archaeon MCA70_species_1]|nr:hypothetical protein [Candidatus Alkanophaga volatiphilum]